MYFYFFTSIIVIYGHIFDYLFYLFIIFSDNISWH